jgi:hypothetical protein
MAVGKATSKGSGTAVAQLANQAAVSQPGAHHHHKQQQQQQQQPEAKPGALSAMRSAWDRLKGWLVGILAAIISTLYTVSLLGHPPVISLLSALVDCSS